MATTTNFGWETPDDTDLVKDGAAAIRTALGGVDTSFVDLKGGTTGQVLSKASNTDLDYTWVTTDDANAIQNAIVDAKGDLIAASAADTPARLAVGNNGETLVADSSTSTGLRYQSAYNGNAVIGGGFDIWQRGTSYSLSAGANTAIADRWNYQQNGSTATVSRQSVGDTTNLPTIQYCARLQRNAGQTSTSANYLSTSLETSMSIPFSGQAVTVSFYARAGANFSSTSNILTAVLQNGTGTDQNLFAYTGSNTVVQQNKTLTTTWQRFTMTATVPANSTELAIYFTYNPTGTAGAADYYEVTGVQLELGSVATTFKRAGGTIQGELAACQRYYYRTTPGTAYGAHAAWGPALATTYARIPINLPVTMRITPTSIDYANLVLFDGVNTMQGVTAVTFSAYENRNLLPIDFTIGSASLTQYRSYLANNNNNTAGYLGFSAEL